MKYKVLVKKYWVEYGEVEIDADSEDAARDLAREMLTDGDDAINWKSDNMEPQEHEVVFVRPVETSKR